MIDRVIAKGSEVPVTLYEVLDALEPAVRSRRVSTREMLERAGDAYRRGDAAAAQAGFEEVLERDPDDRAARLFAERAVELARRSDLSNWDGVTRLVRK